jgi:putative photosynthetic complex assembly protein 2
MEAHGFPALFALLLWWGSTGLVLMLVRRPAHAHPAILVGATVALAVGLFGLLATADETGLVAAYLAFTAGLLVWAWPEIAFLLGYVTGPNQAPSPAGARGWLRFRLAAGTLIWHELAILGCGLLVVAMTWNAPNQVGALTFLVLWALRLSAKLNLYLGARNPGAELLPPKLAHLGSHFRTAPMNALFPISVCFAIAGAAWFGWAALAAETVAEAAGHSFLATLLALAALEHVLLMLPIPASTLFAAWLGARPANGAPKNPTKTPNGTDLGRAELRSLARTEAT